MQKLNKDDLRLQSRLWFLVVVGLIIPPRLISALPQLHHLHPIRTRNLLCQNAVLQRESRKWQAKLKVVWGCSWTFLASTQCFLLDPYRWGKIALAALFEQNYPAEESNVDVQTKWVWTDVQFDQSIYLIQHKDFFRKCMLTSFYLPVPEFCLYKSSPCCLGPLLQFVLCHVWQILTSFSPSEAHGFFYWEHCTE